LSCWRTWWWFLSFWRTWNIGVTNDHAYVQLSGPSLIHDLSPGLF
jgi:hypothetical protein